MEAEFFGIDSLEESCKDAIAHMKEALKPRKPVQAPKARVWSAVVEADRSLTINLDKGEVIYVQSATLAGKCVARRYAESEEQRQEREAGEHPDFVANGVYLNTCRVSGEHHRSYPHAPAPSLIHCQRTHKPADVRLEIPVTSNSRSSGTTPRMAAADGQPVTTTTAPMAREVMVHGTTPLSTWLSMRTKVGYSHG